MKTKNIFKTLAAAMLMPAMLLTTACSSEDDFAGNENTENAAKKGYTLPVTVNVTRQGDEAATRAAFNGETKKLEFSTGDKLFVSGSQATAGSFAGTLEYVSDGTFSGTITTENEYPGTVDDLFASAYAYLLPDGYAGYGYLSISGSGYSAYHGFDMTKAFALSKAAAVEQLSQEWAYGYSSGFALEPNNAILNFTISGLAASAEVAVVFTIYDYGEIYATITGNVTTDASGTATFAIGVEYGTELNDCTLTVGGNAITLVSSSKEVEAGKIYNVSRSVTPATPTLNITSPAVGQVIGSDGKNYAAANVPSGVDKVAMIAYVSGSNGLAIALADEGLLNWATAKSTCEAKTPAFSNGTWKLPSQDEWKQMFIANGGNEDSYDGLNTAIITAGGTAFQDGTVSYWSSSEYDSDQAHLAQFYYGYPLWYKDWKVNEDYVRACLAF